jgi:hypothetical protein
MKPLIMLIALVSSSVAAAAEPKLPIHPGQYTFQHKFAEHPNMQSISLTAKITGRHIVLINEVQSEVFPKGVIADGTLMWHSKSKQWIIGQNKSDRHAKDVGGCSDGPEVVELEQRVYWTC